MNWKNSALPVDGVAFANYVIDYITSSESDGFKVAILGDFNADAEKFSLHLTTGAYIPHIINCSHFYILVALLNYHPKTSNLGLSPPSIMHLIVPPAVLT